MESDPPFVKEIDAKAAQGDEGCKAAATCVQAMRSVICGNRCPVSATAYFAATVAALQKQGDRKDLASDAATTSALLLVLKKALPAVQASAVQARFNDLAEALAAVLKVPDNESIVRQALMCMSVAADIAFNTGSRPNRKVLRPVFSLLGDTRTPVRHQAELAATLIIKRAAAVSDKQTLDFAAKHLEQAIAAARPDKKVGGDSPAQHAIGLLRAVAPLLPQDSVSNLCTELLRLPATLGQHPCCTSAFEFLAGHLGRQDDGAAQREQSAALAVHVFPGLLSVPLTMLNLTYVVAYAQALASAASALSSVQVAATVSPDVQRQKMAAMRRLVALFAERDPTLLRGAREASLSVFSAAGSGGDVAFLEMLPDACRPLLGYEYKGAWPHALLVIRGLFEALGCIRTNVSPAEIPEWTKARFEKVRGLLSDLVQIRDKARGSELNVFGKELSQCIGSAVAAFGPEAVLQVADIQLLQPPLSDRNYEQLSRSWMLLVLREHCCRTALAFFASTFMPLASTIRAQATEAQTASPVYARKYETLLEHIWALLPAFCNEPLDLSAALLAEGGRLAKQLVSVMLNEKQFREHVWEAFTRLCDATREPPSALAQALRQSNETCLRTLSGRVLPEMFNAYMKFHAEAEGQDASIAGHSRQVALGAVQSYVRVAEPSLVGNLFKTLVARMLKATSAGAGTTDTPGQDQGVPLAELACAIVPHLAPEFLELTLKVFTPMLNSAAVTGDEEQGAATTAATLQKVAYRAIFNVMQHSAASKIGDAGKILEIWSIFRDARQTCMMPAIKARLKAMEALFLLMQERLAVHFKEPAVRQGFLECLKTALPEIMQHLRDPGNALRDAARDCLHVAITTAIHQDLQAEIVTLISAGLAGLTRLSKANAVDALSRLMYEHGTLLQEELRQRLIMVVLLLLEDIDVQVFRAALKFTKVVAYVVPQEDLEKVLPQILKLFHNPHLASAKTQVRNIITRLAKVLPEALLTEHFPKAHLPLLQYVQRQLTRQQRPKTMREPAAQDDAAEEDAEMAGTEDSQKATWDAFQEEGDGDGGQEEGNTAAGGARRKLRRAGAAGAPGTAERTSAPPISAVMAHEAVQALLDAWEAEGGEEVGEKRQGRGKRKRDADQTSTWIHEDQDVPLDFMSADAAHSVLTSRPPQLKRQRGTEMGSAGAENRADALRRSGLRFAEDGRLVVSEEAVDEKMEEKEGAKLFNLGDAKKASPLSKLAAQRKLLAARKARARLARTGAHTIEGMERFKPKKQAQGDAKRKGSTLKPYAYVRLNPKVVKEKYKDKASASFAKVVKGAKKGVLRGKKAKARDAKNKNTANARKQKRLKKPHKPGAR